MNWLLFPPKTREVQLDERWSFVGKKQRNCDPTKRKDRRFGNNWDHTAVDPEHRLVLSVVPGKRSVERCEEVVNDVKRRTGGRTDMLYATDDFSGYKGAIKRAYAQKIPRPRRPGPGRPRRPEQVMPDDLCYATVKKTRKNGKVVKVRRTIVFGPQSLLDAYLSRSTVSNAINTSFVERNNGTERCQNGRKVRKTYGFSKDWELHNAMSYYVAYSYNFCWPVRTLRIKGSDGKWQKRTPAMAAGLTDHVWSLREWLTYPAVQQQ